MPSFINTYHRNSSKINFLEVYIHYDLSRGVSFFLQTHTYCKSVSFSWSQHCFIDLHQLRMCPVFLMCTYEKFPSLPLNLIILYRSEYSKLYVAFEEGKWKWNDVFVIYFFFFYKFLQKQIWSFILSLNHFSPLLEGNCCWVLLKKKKDIHPLFSPSSLFF